MKKTTQHKNLKEQAVAEITAFTGNDRYQHTAEAVHQLLRPADGASCPYWHLIQSFKKLLFNPAILQQFINLSQEKPEAIYEALANLETFFDCFMEEEPMAEMSLYRIENDLADDQQTATDLKYFHRMNELKRAEEQIKETGIGVVFSKS